MPGQEYARSPKPQLVLLDHGLYRELSEEFRVNYCHLYKSICEGDLAGIRKYSEYMQAAHAWKLFASMLTATSFDQVENRSLGAKKLSATDRDRMQSYATQHMDGISELLARIPRPLLLLLKTMDCLRAVERQLDTPVNTYTIMVWFVCACVVCVCPRPSVFLVSQVSMRVFVALCVRSMLLFP
jgi:aarF domain-containing kinase